MDENAGQVRHSRDRKERDNHQNDIQLTLLEKDGTKLLEALNAGHMVAILSGMEIMYVFVFRNEFQCFLHKMDDTEGRRKSWKVNERNTAMMKNLTSMADQLFEIIPKPDMHPIGVMVAAEKGIISYLDMTGQLPAEDTDFMDWMDEKEEQT